MPEIKRAITKRQRDLVFAFRQVQGIFKGVANKEISEQSRIHIEPGDSQCVVVIPELGRFLIVGIEVDGRFSRDKPILGIAVTLGGHLAPMEMGHSSHRGFALVRAVNAVINRKKVIFRQLVCPFHQYLLAATSFKRWPREALSEAPDPCWFHVAMNLAGELAHGEVVVRDQGGWMFWMRAVALWPDNAWKRQGIHEPFEGFRLEKRRGSDGCSAGVGLSRGKAGDENSRATQELAARKRRKRSYHSSPKWKRRVRSKTACLSLNVNNSR